MAKTPVERDVYGLSLDSKNHQAAMLFEKGISHAELKDRLGREFYNLEKKLAAAGHTITKEGKTIYLKPKVEASQ